MIITGSWDYFKVSNYCTTNDHIYQKKMRINNKKRLSPILSTQIISNYCHSFFRGNVCHYLFMTPLSSGAPLGARIVVQQEEQRNTNFSWLRMTALPRCLNPCKLLLACFVPNMWIITVSVNTGERCAFGPKAQLFPT